MTRRALAVVGIVLCGGASIVLAALLAVRYTERALPTGSRASMPSVASSDQIDFGGRSWYSEAEAASLQSELAAAVEGTDWCLGWAVVVDDRGFQQADVGSSQGVDRSARTCRHWVEVEVVYVYTSSSASQEDNAQLAVTSSDLDVAQVFWDHPGYQVSAGDLLHEDRGTSRDDVIGNAIAGMPLVLAEAGRLDPLAVEPVPEGTEGSVTFADQEGEGGSDLWRARGHWLLAAGLAVALGVTVVLMAWLRFPSQVFAASPVTARGPDGRPVNPRRALKAALDRARREEEQGALGRDIH